MNPAELPLRDIHLPDPIGWWPPAPGWWVVGGLLLFLVFTLIHFWRRRLAWRRSPAYIARCELSKLQSAWREHGDTHRLAREVSVWLRRVGMSMRTRQQAASLTGARWWRYLDELAGETVFSDGGGGRLISDAPYRASADIDAQQLMVLCERWLESLGKTTQAGSS